MLRQTPNRRHRWLAPANSDLESSYESRPGYHTVEVHTQAGPTQVSLHNQAVEALVGVAIFASFSARAMPTSASAPQIGQRVPDFTLADTNDQPVSLAQLLAQAANDSKVMPAKSGLLIFYRGYW